MRLVLSIVLLAGCVMESSDPPPTGDPGGLITPDPSAYGCKRDADCSSSKICARDHECYSAANVGTGHVTWTLHGKPASVGTCFTMPELLLQFRGANGESFGYAPVPCENGSFFVDKFPKVYTTVELGPKDSLGHTNATIDRETGEALVLLP